MARKNEQGQLALDGMPNGGRPEGGLAGTQTKNGYWMDEVRSAIQKEIRRGNEEDALFWVQEMLSVGWVGYMWSTLFTIVAEDIGLANPDLPAQVMALKQMSDAIAEGSKWQKYSGNHVTMAVCLMCRSPKNREACELDWIIAEKRKKGFRLEVPDYAIDMHTFRGKAMGRDIEFFYAEGAKLHPDVGPWKYTREAIEMVNRTEGRNIPLPGEDQE